MKFGIDFGTCYSSAALLIDGTLHPAKEPLRPLESCFPSSICVTKKGEIVISQAAENLRRLNPQGYKNHFKRDLDTDIPYFLGEQQLRFLPEDLVTVMLRGLKKEAEKIINSSIDSAIITVPATYLINKKQLMEQAAKKAGFNEVALLEEPVAAAIYYSLKGTMGHQLNEGDILLVYDLGGGTFDAALIQKKGNSYDLLGQPVGDKQCGGIYFDQLIAQDFIEQLHEVSARELLTSHRQDKEAIRSKLDLEDWCRNFKHQLSMVDEYEDLPPVGSDSYSLSRDKFEKMLTPFIDRSCDLCQQLVQQAGIKWESINRILLVGGSCRIPYVQKRLEQQFKRPVVAIDDPELAICFGATIYGVDLKQAKETECKLREKELYQRGKQIEDDLSSAKGVDYRELRELLKAGNWKEADQETLKVMLRVVFQWSNSSLPPWLSINEIDNFPLVDINTIDRLWEKYSDGKFGFSVQQKIWQECSNWEEFGKCVGWKVDKSWIVNNEWSNHIRETSNTWYPSKGYFPLKIYWIDYPDDFRYNSSEGEKELHIDYPDWNTEAPSRVEIRFSSLLNKLVNCSEICEQIKEQKQEQDQPKKQSFLSEGKTGNWVNGNFIEIQIKEAELQRQNQVELELERQQKLEQQRQEAEQLRQKQAEVEISLKTFHDYEDYLRWFKGDSPTMEPFSETNFYHSLRFNRTQKLEQQRQEQLKQETAEKQKRQQREAEQLEKAQSQQVAQTTSTDELASEKGINYTNLRDLLKQQNWQAADKETADRMCEAMGRQNEGWLRVEDAQNFPCADLRTIDQLWVKHSRGKFGFSVQKEIWQSCGSPTKSNEKWEKFGELVGWKDPTGWVGSWSWYIYINYRFTLKASKGHLPSGRYFGWGDGGGESLINVGDCFVGVVFGFSSLVRRLVNCNNIVALPN